MLLPRSVQESEPLLAPLSDVGRILILANEGIAINVIIASKTNFERKILRVFMISS